MSGKKYKEIGREEIDELLTAAAKRPDSLTIDGYPAVYRRNELFQLPHKDLKFPWWLRLRDLDGAIMESTENTIILHCSDIVTCKPFDIAIQKI